MSTPEQDRPKVRLDYPNHEVLGLPPPWVEGTGGGATASTSSTAASTSSGYVTKQQLLDQALGMGLDVNDAMTKAEIEAAIAAAG